MARPQHGHRTATARSQCSHSTDTSHAQAQHVHSTGIPSRVCSTNMGTAQNGHPHNHCTHCTVPAQSRSQHGHSTVTAGCASRLGQTSPWQPHLHFVPGLHRSRGGLLRRLGSGVGAEDAVDALACHCAVGSGGSGVRRQCRHREIPRPKTRRLVLIVHFLRAKARVGGGRGV